MTKLFHYTSINNLALILRTKSIRFGRLDHVNDPTEGLVSDFHSLAPYIFVSCWTANHEENFALWNMYTQNMRGVRIELELPIFRSYKIDNVGNFVFNKTEFLNEEKGYCIIGGQNIPHKIEYTDDESKLNPTILDDIGINLECVATYKKTIWSIEQEYRYRLEIIPIDKNLQSEYFPDRYQHLIEKKTPPPIDGYLVKLSENSFKKMKIMSSPKIQIGDIEIIEALIKTYNKDATIQKSELFGLIR